MTPAQLAVLQVLAQGGTLDAHRSLTDASSGYVRQITRSTFYELGRAGFIDGHRTLTPAGREQVARLTRSTMTRPIAEPTAAHHARMILLDAIANFEANPHDTGTIAWCNLGRALGTYEAMGDHDHGRGVLAPGAPCPGGDCTVHRARKLLLTTLGVR